VPVALDKGCYIEEIARTGSPPPGEHLVGGEIVGMEHWPGVPHDTVMQPALVGKHLDHAFGTRRWVDGEENGDHAVVVRCGA
jgi:hypothetical protein